VGSERVSNPSSQFPSPKIRVYLKLVPLPRRSALPFAPLPSVSGIPFSRLCPIRGWQLSVGHAIPTRKLARLTLCHDQIFARHRSSNDILCNFLQANEEEKLCFT
jgi:hypothetical protein